MPTRLDATVRGIVQGVGFRMFVVDAASRLGVSGWVANERGGVRIVAEGDRATLEQLLAELRRGPPAALVDDVLLAWMPATGEYADFSIRSAWHSGD